MIGIGGIDLANARQVIDAGATGIAAIGLFTTAANMTTLTRDLRTALTQPEGTV